MAATDVGVDGCFGDDAAKNMSTSIVTSGSGYMFTDTGWLMVKRGGISSQKI